MKKALFNTLNILFFTLVFTSSQFAQHNEGYIIKKDGTRITCLLNIRDIENNCPSKIHFKISENGVSQSLAPNEVLEFGIIDEIKFISALVTIDKSSDKTNILDPSLKTEYESKQLFIKVLLEGDYNFYQYITSDQERYFYTQGNELILLEYKKYLKYNILKYATNYKTQLWNISNCLDFSIYNLNKLEYGLKSLKEHFIKLNSCSNGSYKEYQTRVRFDFFDTFQFSLLGGIANQSWKFLNTGNSRLGELDLGSQTSFTYGLDLEIMLNPYKQNVALCASALYTTYNEVSEFNVTFDIPVIMEISLNNIEIPLGIRYYFGGMERKKAFFDAQYIINFPQLNEITYSFYLIEADEIPTRNVMSLGAGYNMISSFDIYGQLNFIKQQETIITERPLERSQFKILLRYRF